MATQTRRPRAEERLVALHTTIYDPGLILLVSPTLRQSKELFAKTAGVLPVRIQAVVCTAKLRRG
jgi:hypothetical protein